MNKLCLSYALVLTVLASSCGSGEQAPAGPTVLKGAGATAPNLLYAKWTEEFNKIEPLIKVEYEAIGSGEGIQALEAGTVDFAASDMALDDAQIERMKVKPMHFPTVVSAVVAVYNLSGVDALQLTPEALAGIYTGKITAWNHPAIARENAGAALPAGKIAVFRRAGVSGTSHAFGEYLAGSGAATLSAGTEVAGSQAMAEAVKSTPNSIGYLDLNYAVEERLARAAVRNAAGRFVSANLQTQAGALEMAQNIGKDLRGSLTNAPGEESYPICMLTWLVVPMEFPTKAEAAAMKRFLRWAYSDGQQLAGPLDYGILQPPLLDRVRDQVDAIRSTEK